LTSTIILNIHRQPSTMNSELCRCTQRLNALNSLLDSFIPQYAAVTFRDENCT